MAISLLQFSVGVIDADGNAKSVPLYARYDDGVATLSDILAYIRTTTGLLDSVTDAKVTGITAQLNVSLPLGMKAAPVAGSNVQETGLISFTLGGLESRSFGQDIPAIAQATLTGKVIDQSNVFMENWIERMTTPSTLTFLNDDFAYVLATPVKKAVKTFRK